MRHLDFKYGRADNFLCFKHIEIDFKALGPIVLIRGQNLDISDNGNNGTGKSSVAEIPTYALFGKTIKKPTKLGHTDLINHQFGKKLEVEFCWDDYRVVRARKPESLRFWESKDGDWCDATEITCGGMPATQKEIEKRLGLSYETFVNLIVFTDDNSNSFLECDIPTKREIIENLLSLDKYRNYFENAKSFVKGAKEKIKNLAKEYERLLIEKDACQGRVFRVEKQEQDWKTARTDELRHLMGSIKNKKAELENSDMGVFLAAYQEAQERIATLRLTIPDLEVSREKYSKGVEVIKPQLESLVSQYEELTKQQKTAEWKIGEASEKISENQKLIEDTQAGGDLCPYCEGKLDVEKQEATIAKARGNIKKQEAICEAMSPILADLVVKVTECRGKVTKYEKGLQDTRSRLDKANKELTETHSKISAYAKIKEPKAGVDELLLQEQLDELKKQALVKKAEVDGPGPFMEIKKAAETEMFDKQAECDTKKSEVQKAETELPYYDFWVKAFGDTGIRKYVIQGILPALNTRIAFWLQFLADNKISLTLDSELKETVDRVPFKGRPYAYYGLSNGQRRRLILALSQALAHIQMLNAGASPSVVWLDEVSINLDESGVEGAYRMICELAKEKQVFVIDHNESLLQALDGCDTIYLQMKDEVTSRVESF